MSTEITNAGEAIESAIRWLEEPVDENEATIALAWATTSIAMSLIRIRDIMAAADHDRRLEKLP